MLQWIRDRVTGVVAFIILGLLSIPFIFFGIDQYTRTVAPESVALVGDEEITRGEFQTSFSRYRSQLRAQLGDAYDDRLVNQPASRRAHLEDMIDERLLRQYAVKAGLQTPRESVFALIREFPQFQVAGQFDEQLYLRVLSAQGLTHQRFVNDLTEGMLARILPGAISGSAIVLDDEVNRALVLQNETRAVSLIEIPSAPYREGIDVGDDQIEAYYTDHPNEFMTPEQVVLEYLELDASTLTATGEIDEDTLRRHYDAVRARYMTPERRRAAHILITANQERDGAEAEALAWELTERAREGESFAELAQAWSDDSISAAEGGDLGWIEPEVMARAFEDALYALEPGEVSDPVRTGFGWHVIRLDAVEEARGQSFAEAREEIEEELRATEVEDLYYELQERLVEFVYTDPTTLEPIADELDLEIQRTAPFTRSGGEGIAANSEVVEAAFSDLVLLDRDTSEPIELDSNHLVVVRVAEHIPAERRSLEAVSDELRERLVRERAIELAREQAEALAETLHAEGADAEAIAGEHELELQHFDALSRRDFELGGQFVNAIFDLSPPAEGVPGVHVLPKGSDWAVVMLEAVTPGDPEQADDAQRQRLRQQIRFAQSGSEVSGLVAYLRENAKIRIEEDRLEDRF